MEYRRSFIIQSSHFNDNPIHDLYDAALRDRAAGEHEQAGTKLLTVMKESHGHNFKVDIRATSTVLRDSECDRGAGTLVVRDETLESVVREWDNTNISMHPDFKGIRATTELMAEVLVQKLRALYSGVAFQVTVWERDEIAAVATGGNAV